MELKTQIEVWLLTQTDWVPSAVICERFQVDERKLRASNGHPGLLTEFAISHSRLGYKHVRHATKEEYIEARSQAVSHIKSDAKRVRGWDQRRQTEKVGLRPHQVEKFTGQILLPV